jgi:hypothetical protein
MVLEQTLTEAGGAVNVTVRVGSGTGSVVHDGAGPGSDGVRHRSGYPKKGVRSQGNGVSPSSQLVTAPSEAEETCLAYFAMTPEV